MGLGEIQPPFGTTKDSITLDDYLAKYNSSPVEQLNFLAPRKTITGKFVPDKKENETMNLGTKEQRTDGMKKQAQELIEQAYNRGYKAGREDGYEDWKNSVFNNVKSFIEQGRNEAWETMRTIIGLGEPLEICGVKGFRSFVCGISASEAIERIRAYKEQKKQKEAEEIHVGDVIRKDDVEAVVTWCDGKDWNGFLLKGEDVGEVGQVYSCMSCNGWKKTGRNLQEIAEVLKKLKESE